MELIIKEDPELMQKRIRAVLALRDTSVKVGLPDKAGDRLHFILAVQEHGSPIKHIPSRPVIQPALRKRVVREAMASAMKEAVRTAWEGNDPRDQLEEVGRAGADGIRKYIDSHIPLPNSPLTVEGKGFNKPLFDTGALYNAFDYEIEE